jgi:glycosyltransferase involved in cell wall biosynthesis
MRVCIVYDCLYPYTVGGAERWYGALARRLAAAGHEVTYLTRRQWDGAEPPDLPGVRVVAVSPGGPLYTEDGRRTIRSPLRFGLGVLLHLLRHRDAYDAVHTCAFPYFSLLAARLALLGRPVALSVDWFEVWSRAYWSEYLGGLGGRIGHLVQKLCVRLTPRAFVFSRLYAARLREEGLRGPVRELAGLYAGDGAVPGADERPPLVVFAGRHIPEKHVPALPPAIAAARERVPELRGLILGDGPDRLRVLEEIARLNLDGVVEAPGFVDVAEVGAALSRASCLVLPSIREGYGLVVIEAAAAGTPSVVARAPDNAAVELIAEGENGVLAASPEPPDLVEAIVRVHEAGEALRAATRAWFEANAARLSLDASLAEVVESYSASAHR